MKAKIFWFIVVLLILALAACAGGPGGGPAADTPEVASTTAAGEDSSAADKPAEDESAAEVVEAGPQLAEELAVYNWNDYIDEELLTKYEDAYGVNIIYDTYASNEDLLAKLQAGATGFDVIFPSDYMVSQMLELDLLAEIDAAGMPNFANINAEFKDAPYDPGNKHCVPYQWGTTGIGYRADYEFFEENVPDSWAYLFEPELLEQYAGDGINVLNDQRELMATALFYLSYSPNSTNEAELSAARDLILTAKPYWKTFNSEDYDDTLLSTNEVVLSHGWSGDVATAYWNTYDEETEDGNWYYAIPKEGAIKWLDNICITASTKRFDTAVHFINFLLDAENAAAVTNFTYYASPNEAASEFIEAEILEDPGIYPTDEVFARLEWLREVGDAVFLYDEMWTAIKGQ